MPHGRRLKIRDEYYQLVLRSHQDRHVRKPCAECAFLYQDCTGLPRMYCQMHKRTVWKKLEGLHSDLLKLKEMTDESASNL